MVQKFLVEQISMGTKYLEANNIPVNFLLNPNDKD